MLLETKREAWLRAVYASYYRSDAAKIAIATFHKGHPTRCR
ncbi:MULTISPECIES: hypothetical protein [unclassified Coleofasciculus]|nr:MULTISPECIES: hypothetical protein [unclassified Coleofasciculus]